MFLANCRLFLEKFHDDLHIICAVFASSESNIQDAGVVKATKSDEWECGEDIFKHLATSLSDSDLIEGMVRYSPG